VRYIYIYIYIYIYNFRYLDDGILSEDNRPNMSPECVSYEGNRREG